MNLVKSLKGGSLSKTEVYEGPQGLIVRKSISSLENREYGLVRWQSQIRKLQTLSHFLPENVAPVIGMGVEDCNYFYEIPYYEGAVDCYRAVKGGESVEKIAFKLLDLLHKMSSVKMQEIVGSISVYISEEIEVPLKCALKSVRNSNLELSVDVIETITASIIDALNISRDLKSKYKEYKTTETLTHGNLTLENVLWDPKEESLRIIDPYFETYSEIILGDYSQLLQSTCSGYEEVVNYLDWNNFDVLDYPYPAIDHGFIKLGKILEEAVKAESWYKEDIVNIYHASQFIRMFPFKLVNAPLQGVLFLMHGINLLRRNCDA